MTTFARELVPLWEACEAALVNTTQCVNHLEEVLREHGITEQSMLMDVSGGHGFPSIELAKRGYMISYNDGSQEMFHRMVLNADKAGAPSYLYWGATVGPGMMRWQDFNQLGSDAWDGLICRGNSLPYAISWGEGTPDLTAAKQAILATLCQFSRILTTNGILLVDKQPEAQVDEFIELPGLDVDGESRDVTWELFNDRAHHVRNWTMRERNPTTGEEHAYHSRGYLLQEADLVSMLRSAGFNRVEKIGRLRGDIYETFLAVKDPQHA